MEQREDYLRRALTRGHYIYLSCCFSAVRLAQPQLPKPCAPSRTGPSPAVGPAPPDDSSTVLAQHAKCSRPRLGAAHREA